MKAADLSEPAILAVLAKNPGEGHTHWTGDGAMLKVLDPEHLDAPQKVLVAKLNKMVRKGLIGGNYPCLVDGRGDWYWPPKRERPQWFTYALASGRYLARCDGGTVPGMDRMNHRMYRWCAYQYHPAPVWYWLTPS